MLKADPGPIHQDSVGIRIDGGSLFANDQAIDAYAPCLNPLFAGSPRGDAAGGKEFL
jgi:hypothetical protein